MDYSKPKFKPGQPVWYVNSVTGKITKCKCKNKTCTGSTYETKSQVLRAYIQVITEQYHTFKENKKEFWGRTYTLRTTKSDKQNYNIIGIYRAGTYSKSKINFFEYELFTTKKEAEQVAVKLEESYWEG